MTGLRIGGCVLAALLPLAAQTAAPQPAPTPPGPFKIEIACKLDDIEALGLSCTEEEPCPVYVELSGVESIGSRVILIGNLHTEANTLFSLLLVSEDGGKTWAEGAARIRSASFDRVQFAGLEKGWISGGLNLSLPRDPFFLVSSDGGKSWRDRPVFDDGHIGRIADFHFENELAGLLLIDRTRRSENGTRYELHETRTGGDTWEPKRFSPTPLPIPKPKTEANAEFAVWRLRADSKSKTIRLEQNSGKTWVSMAAFPIRVGECKPPMPTPTPPAQ